MGGGDKGRLMLGQHTLIQHVIDRIQPQVQELVLSANGDLTRFDDLGLPCVADSIANFPGPLAGVLAGLDWAAQRGHQTLYSVATDTPFFPLDWVEQMAQAPGRIVLSATPHEQRGRLPQPTFARWPVELREPLREALTLGVRKIRQFTQAQGEGWVVFDQQDFFNINTPEDLAAAQARLA